MTLADADIYDPFAANDMLTVSEVAVAGPGRLRAAFSDGVSREIDLQALIARSRWFHTLSEPATFETVEIINGGRGIQWVTGADFCVDALRILGDRQAAGYPE